MNEHIFSIDIMKTTRLIVGRWELIKKIVMIKGRFVSKGNGVVKQKA